jgi:hypothetical protein
MPLERTDENIDPIPQQSSCAFTSEFRVMIIMVIKNTVAIFFIASP